MRAAWLRNHFPGVVAASTLLVGLALTALGSYGALQHARGVAQLRFHQSGDDLFNQLRDHLTRPRYGLGGLRSSFATADAVPDVAAFRRAVLARNLPLEFPGVLGFGFIQPVPRAELPRFLAELQREYGQTITVSHDGGHDTLYLVRSVEPLESNRPALAMDASFEASRREALQQADALGALALSAPIHLPQSRPGTLGTLYLLPVYATGQPVSHRPLGFLYAAVDYTTLLSGTDLYRSWLDYRLVDLDAPGTQAVYAIGSGPGQPARFEERFPFGLGGRHFVLEVSSTPAFDAQMQDPTPWYIAAFGVALSLLLAALTGVLARGRARALALAQAMTEKLEHMAMVARLTTNAVIVSDAQGVIRWVNPAFQHITGFTAEEAIGRKPGRLLNPQRLKSPEASRLGQCLRAGSAFHGQLCNHAKNGRPYLVSVEVQPFQRPDGALAGFVMIQTDITEKRRVEKALLESRAFLRRTGAIAGVGGWQLELKSRQITWSPQARRIHEVTDAFEPTIENWLQFYPEPGHSQLKDAIRQAMHTGEGWDFELPFQSYLGHALWVRMVGAIEYDEDKPARLAGAVQDITARKQAELALAQNRELLRVTLTSIGDAVLTTDLEARVQWLNPVAERMTGWRQEDAAGKPATEVLQLINEYSRQPTENPLLACLELGQPVELARDTVLVSRHGTEYAIDDSVAPIRDADGQLLGAVMVFHDTTESRQQTRELIHRASKHDPLTGLSNRMELERRINAMLQRAPGTAVPGALLFIDLDHFKMVNDSAGHSAGDQVLIELAGLLKQAAQPQDTVARLGSDEFAILLEDCGQEPALAAARSICAQIDRHRFKINEQRFRVGASVGVVPIGGQWSQAHELVQAADVSCYAAKDEGRNRVHLWRADDATLHARLSQSAWGPRIETALDERRFELYAQRIVPLQPARLELPETLHCELLLRMRDTDGKLVLPSSFIPAAEHFQLAGRIDRWVLQEAFEQLAEAALAGVRLGLVAINLSGQSLGDRRFHTFVRRLIEQARFDVSVLCLEITETTAITNLELAVTFLKEMRRLGIQLALDDFGTGASSFGYLKRLDVDFLKIDGQFVRGLTSNPLDAVSVSSFCGVAKVLGIRTIAEFVDRQPLLEVVRDLGVDYAQGYLLHVPEPLSHLIQAACPQGTAEP